VTGASGAWRLALGAALLLGAACNPQMARYDAAVARMTALDARVDGAFDAARSQNNAIFPAPAWDHPAAVAAALTRARDRMTEAVADHERRLATERDILSMDVLAGMPDQRALYTLDLKAQEAKGRVLALTLEMYRELLADVESRQRDAFEAQTRAYAARIRDANDRFRELDLERQRSQQARHPG
jgi:hypothetical protein